MPLTAALAGNASFERLALIALGALLGLVALIARVDLVALVVIAGVYETARHRSIVGRNWSWILHACGH